MCDTCATETATTATVGVTGGITATYDVEGMTCGHCVNSVSTEVGAVPGVTDVSVDLAAGKVTVVSASPIDVDAIAKAVDEAGYRLAS
jgi:copper ion binding protein